MNFYCRSYCLLNMFRAPLCPSSGAREYYKSGCCLSYLVLGFGCCYSPQTGHTTLSSTPYRQLENQAPNMTGSNHFYNTLELLMMGIMVPETCWASNKICNKNHLLHLVGILFPHINDDALSKPHQIQYFHFSGPKIIAWWLQMWRTSNLILSTPWRVGDRFWAWPTHADIGTALPPPPEIHLSAYRNIKPTFIYATPCALNNRLQLRWGCSQWK